MGRSEPAADEHVHATGIWRDTRGSERDNLGNPRGRAPGQRLPGGSRLPVPEGHCREEENPHVRKAGQAPLGGDGAGAGASRAPSLPFAAVAAPGPPCLRLELFYSSIKGDETQDAAMKRTPAKGKPRTLV